MKNKKKIEITGRINALLEQNPKLITLKSEEVKEVIEKLSFIKSKNEGYLRLFNNLSG